MEYTQNHIIVLFKNKVKKKIIKKFKTLSKAENYYALLIKESDNVIFPKQYENGVESEYEIGLLIPRTNEVNKVFIKDDLGRQVKVEIDDSNYAISKITPIKIDEYFVDYGKNQKINTSVFIDTYLSKKGLKLISKLNNKIVVQNDNDYSLFTFKNDDDSSRFIDHLSINFIKSGRTDCMFVKDYNTLQRKYLYDLLVKNGFSKSYLLRHSTTHPIKK